MFQFSSEFAVALLIGLVGLIGWITRMSFKLSAFKPSQKTERKSHSQQLDAQEERLHDHETRRSTLE